MSLRISEVTENNWRSVASLKVAKDQQKFIESNAFSLAESKYENNATSLALYDGNTPVGYAMYGWYSDKNDSIWLDRFMIDFHFQGKGYAKCFLSLLIEYLQQRFKCKKILLSLHPDNNVAQGIYESFGFRLTGDIDDEGPVVGNVMELNIEEM
ncbi:GNAT family N-acetyltransferase [Bacillus cereus]|nr:GNAT family N-acetyltransferase [Bacillus cereus]